MRMLYSFKDNYSITEREERRTDVEDVLPVSPVSPWPLKSSKCKREGACENSNRRPSSNTNKKDQKPTVAAAVAVAIAAAAAASAAALRIRCIVCSLICCYLVDLSDSFGTFTRQDPCWQNEQKISNKWAIKSLIALKLGA